MRPFPPSDDEHALYEAVSGFLQREDSYALPQRQRHLAALILRKLLASSSLAIAATLDKLRTRLESLRDAKVQDDAEFPEGLIEAEELEDDLLDEILAEPDDAKTETAPRKALIFTESHGYGGQVVLFNGTNGGPEATAIYER